MRRLILLAAALAATPALAANNYAVKDAAAVTIAKCSAQQSDGSQADCNVLIDLSGAKIDPATKQLQQQMLTALAGLTTALGTPLQANGTVNLGTIGGAATAAKQDALLTAVGGLLPPGGKVDTILAGAAVNRGATVTTAGTAQQLMAANTARRGFAIQNQSSGACYISGIGTATQDFNSLRIDAGAYFETPPTHVGTGAVSIVCAAAAAPVYAREW